MLKVQKNYGMCGEIELANFSRYFENKTDPL